MRTLQLSLLSISAVAAALFALGLAVSFVRPVTVEALVSDLLRREVERQVGAQIGRLDGGAFSKLAANLSDANARRVAQLRRELPAAVSAVVAEMRDPDCECRRFFTAAGTTLLKAELITRSNFGDQLRRVGRAKYVEVAQSLLREFRIFTGANALVFLLLFVTTYVRRRAGLQLLLPAFVLVGSAMIVAALYLFGQNWLTTVLFSDYVGFGYFAYLGLAAAFLSDVAFNRARISTRVVNAAFNSVGATLSAVPC